MAAGKGFFLERLMRVVRTVWFVVVMMTSLLVLCLPVLVGVCDVVVMWGLLTRFSCVSCVGLMESFRRYEFRRSLVDVPLVSLVRSLIITCMCSNFVIRFVCTCW